MKQFFLFREKELDYWTVHELDSPVLTDRFEKFPFYPHWVCPSCGLEWAKVMPEEFRSGQQHSFFHLRCPGCGSGSLRLWGDYPLSHLPYPLLVREIDLILSHGEKYEFANLR